MLKTTQMSSIQKAETDETTYNPMNDKIWIAYQLRLEYLPI